LACWGSVWSARRVGARAARIIERAIAEQARALSWMSHRLPAALAQLAQERSFRIRGALETPHARPTRCVCSTRRAALPSASGAARPPPPAKHRTIGMNAARPPTVLAEAASRSTSRRGLNAAWAALTPFSNVSATVVRRTLIARPIGSASCRLSKAYTSACPPLAARTPIAALSQAAPASRSAPAAVSIWRQIPASIAPSSSPASTPATDVRKTPTASRSSASSRKGARTARIRADSPAHESRSRFAQDTAACRQSSGT